MNNKYWKQFYKKNEAPTEPSTFARFCIKYINKNDLILDLGCGNGRDTRFLGKYCRIAIGIDLGIENESKEKDNCIFIQEDFKRSNIFNKAENINIYYTRFFLHSIPDKDIKLILDRLKKNSLIMIECRAKEDNPILYNNHDRNLIDYDWLLNELILRNFKIIHKEKNIGLAKYKNEDPCIIRIIAKKK